MSISSTEKKNGKEKEKEIKMFPFFFHILPAFQNFHNGDLLSFGRRNFLRHLILWDCFRFVIIQTISHLVKQLHILETWHSVLHIIPWCPQKIQSYDCMEKKKKNTIPPPPPQKNPSQNLENIAVLERCYFCLSFFLALFRQIQSWYNPATAYCWLKPFLLKSERIRIRF